MPQQKVLDINVLRDTQSLASFLESGNFGLLEHYTFTEMTKRKAWSTLSQNMAIVAQYGPTIKILKDPWDVISITLNKETVDPLTLIDEQATRKFPSWVKGVIDPAARASEEPQFVSLAKQSEDFFSTLGPEAHNNIANIAELKTKMPRAVINQIKKSGDIPPEWHHYFQNTAYRKTEAFLVSTGLSLPQNNRLKNFWGFRFCLALGILECYIAVWASLEGKNVEEKLSTIKNDGIDCLHVAYGSFFDGILSNEKKLPFISNNLTTLLNPL